MVSIDNTTFIHYEYNRFKDSLKKLYFVDQSINTRKNVIKIKKSSQNIFFVVIPHKVKICMPALHTCIAGGRDHSN